MRKRRTRNHIIADLSANYVERHVLLCGYTVERVIHDYGIDMLLYTYTPEGEVENETIGIQLKATDHLLLSRDRQTIAYSVDRSDLEYWLGERYPVILIIYDAQDDVAYWVYVQDYARNVQAVPLELVGATMTVHLHRSQIVNSDAVRQFAIYKAQVSLQLQKLL